MKTAFIETSAINWLYENNIEPGICNQSLAANNLIPVVGMDTIYELGRTFTTSKPDTGAKLFSWLYRLNPMYSCQRERLYANELDSFLHGSPIAGLLEYYSKEVLTQRLKDFSSGIFSTIHEEFMAGRQFFWDDCREKLWSPNQVKQNRGLVFSDYLQHCLKEIVSNISILQIWLKELTGIQLPQDQANNLLKKLNSYRALRTSLYSQFYLNYLIIKNHTKPREDRFTDSLQLIGASYCSCIISHDKNLLDTLAPNLNPDIDPIRVDFLREDSAIIPIY
ncbi:hypothetical protein Lgee_0141 [Legionella geestiana]|uniref:Uncharacterized protein n=1 Tax=Legionella geestiana TaxID=45065 RepID=A0A0W0U8Q6_9GAMM|nr:hypothetical protein [Legionella geestiana]KTD04388.1 hypothetical protein Lgee_0141 [Legionella geestiana]QBS12956.1 hypothetical protein E4T54_09510 [Legionella geestiana]STX54540.1 Uncharacterised protein [Legionella geestiana]